MKILNIENRKPVVYLQQKNLKGILNTEHSIPRELIKVMRNLRLNSYDETHDEEFVRIEGKEIAEYIASLSWIPDYKQLRDQTDEELQAQLDQRKQEIQTLTDYYNSLSREKQMQNFELLNKRSKINLTIKDLHAYICTQKGTYDLPINIPLGIDTDELHIDMDEFGCIVGISFDKKKVLIAKKNGKQFTTHDAHPAIGLQGAALVLATEAGILSPEDSTGRIKVDMDPTKSFLVAEFISLKTKDDEPQEIFQASEPVLESTPRIKQKSKFRQTIQNLITKTQKDEN